MIYSSLTRICVLSFAACLPGLAGCGSQGTPQDDAAVVDFYAGSYFQAERELEAPAKKTDENFVLSNARLGSVALVRYDLDMAESAFLRAYEVINSVGVNSGGRSLGAAVISENIKIWKGEPFERAMVNFYLGLIYYTRQDYNNARACFENALFKLRDYGPGDDQGDAYREQESNFVLGYLMLGKSYQRLGRNDDAAKAFQRAVQLRSDLAPLADFSRNAQSNVLLVVDYGRGPNKEGTGPDKAIVGFVPTPSEEGPVPSPTVIVDGHRIELDGQDRPPVDLLALAQERQWQSIDTIRAAKSAVGNGIVDAIAIDPLSQPWGLGPIIGRALKGASHADARQWGMLPRTTFLLPVRLSPGKHDIVVDFPVAAELRQEWRGLVVPAQGEATYYYRMLLYNNGPYNWPPGK